MARAWEQAGAVDEANALLRRSQLARELGGVVLDRHLAPLPAAELLAMTQPAHASIAARRARPSTRSCGQPRAGGRRVRRHAPARQPAGRDRAPRRPASGAAADRHARRGRPVAMTPPAPRPGRDGGDGRFARPARPPDSDGTSAAVGATRCASSCSTRLAPGEDRARAHAVARMDAPAGTWTRPDPLAPVDDRAALRRADVRRPAAGRAVAVPARRRERRGRRRRAAGDHAAGDRGLHGRPEPRAQPRAAVARVPRRAHRHRRSASSGTSAASPATPRRSRTSRRSPSGQARRWASTCAAAAASSCCSCAASCCAATRRRRSTPRARRPPARSTRRRGWRRCSAARSRRTSCSSGFALSEESALGIDPAGPGWYFVFEEYPGEPRFGFDEVAAPGVPQHAGRARLGARAAHGRPATSTSPSRCCGRRRTCRPSGARMRPARRR